MKGSRDRPVDGALGPQPGPVEVPEQPMLRLDVPGGSRRSRRRTPTDRRDRPAVVSPAVEAVVAAAAALLLLPTVGSLQREVLQRSGPGFVLAVALSLSAAAVVAGMAHRWLGGGRRRDAAGVGSVAGLLAGSAFGDIALYVGAVWDLLPGVPALRPAALALAVLAVRLSGVPARLLGACAGVATALAVVGAVQAGGPLVASYLPSPVPTDQSLPAQSLPAEQEDPPPPAATGEASPTFGDLCHPDELDVGLGPAVLAGHDVAATVTALNTGDRTCRVEAWPSLQLFSGGEDLSLFVHPSEVDPISGDHVDDKPVLLAPGSSAATQVWWPSWGAAADMDASQRLYLGVGGGTEVVELDPSQRWDVVRSAEAWVAPWQPVE